jgi:hypothetical protein
MTFDLTQVSDEALDAEVARRNMPHVSTLTLFKFPSGSLVIGYNQEKFNSRYVEVLQTLYVSVRDGRIYLTPNKQEHYK